MLELFAHAFDSFIADLMAAIDNLVKSYMLARYPRKSNLSAFKVVRLFMFSPMCLRPMSLICLQLFRSQKCTHFRL